MSRRAAGSDRAAQNASTLKALIKLEGNKVCADCKRNKHPRWASWNLGVFVCIRCSGIHRGMGTHISRVKSVDLDAWTDEQLQSVLKWGNTRANKYWEAKLAFGHAPSEAKIENFIRTKYESKRWVMDGPMPDPSTLDADDDIPLNLVQEKAKIERSASQRMQNSPQRSMQPPPPRQTPAVDLFGDITSDTPARPNTADIPDKRPTRTGPPQATPVAQKPTRPSDSLMGLDFFGGSQSAGIGRPSSAAANPQQSSNPRGDLKNSILSLYAAAPKPQPASQPSHNRQPSFGGMASPVDQNKDAFGGLSDAFGSMSFPSTSGTKSPPVQSPPPGFAGMTNFPTAAPIKATPVAAKVTSPPPLSGGDFFSMTPTSPPVSRAAPALPKSSGGLDFSFTQNAKPASPPARVPTFTPKPAATAIPADIFANDDFGGWTSSAPAPAPAAPAPRVASPISNTNDFNSAFNLSSQPPPRPAAAPVKSSSIPPANSATFDPWGSSATDSSPWGAPDPVPSKPAAPKVDLGRVPSRITPNDISGGWGSPMEQANKSTTQPSVMADEDFGGWTSASTTQTPATSNPPKAGGGFGGTSDPFANPWG